MLRSREISVARIESRTLIIRGSFSVLLLLGLDRGRLESRARPPGSRDFFYSCVNFLT